MNVPNWDNNSNAGALSQIPPPVEITIFWFLKSSMILEQASSYACIKAAAPC